MGSDYRYPNPGRRDVNGVEWHACGPYPTWFRWDEFGLLRTDHAAWADELQTKVHKHSDRSPYRIELFAHEQAMTMLTITDGMTEEEIGAWVVKHIKRLEWAMERGAEAAQIFGGWD
jgi:hypothetical protein